MRYRCDIGVIWLLLFLVYARCTNDCQHLRKITVILRERSLFIAGVGTEEKVFCALKKNLPHHLSKSNILYPTKGK